MLFVGAFVEGELYLSRMQFFPSPFMPFILFCYFIFYCSFFLFSSQDIIRGHCPGMVTNGDSVTHKTFLEMRRFARDETPFPLSMQPKVIALA
jgi:hypothetical protein